MGRRKRGNMGFGMGTMKGRAVLGDLLSYYEKSKKPDQVTFPGFFRNHKRKIICFMHYQI
jgi:hypothetical protein